MCVSFTALSHLAPDGLNNNKVDAVQHVAVLLWVTANGCWAFSDLYVKHRLAKSFSQRTGHSEEGALTPRTRGK